MKETKTEIARQRVACQLWELDSLLGGNKTP